MEPDSFIQLESVWEGFLREWAGSTLRKEELGKLWAALGGPGGQSCIPQCPD